MRGTTTGGKRLNFVATMNTAPLAAGAAKAKGILSTLGGWLKSAGIFAPLAGGAVFALMAKNAADFSKEFQKNMLEVKTISKDAQENFEGLQKQIMDMAANTPDNINTMVRAYYQIVSAGYDGAKAMEILKISTELSTGALTSAFTAADTLTSILNAYGKEAGDVTSISDRLFEVVKNGKTTMEELGQNIGNITGLAAQAGLKLDDLFAAYSTGTKTLKTAEFTTGMRGFLTALIKQQGDAVDKAKELGIEFSISALKSKGLSEFLRDILEKTKGDIEALSALFGNVRGLTGVLSIATDGSKEFAKQLENIENALGNTDRAVKTMAKSVENKWIVVGNKWKRQIKELGDELNTFSGKLADFLDLLLTRRMEDIINPKIIKNVADFKSQLEGVEDVEERRKLVSEKIIELQNKYWETVKQGEKYEKEETPNFLLPRFGTEWRMYEAVKKTYQDDVKIIKGEIEELTDYLNKGVLIEIPINLSLDDGESEKIIKAKIDDIIEKIQILAQKLKKDPALNETIFSQITDQLKLIPETTSMKGAQETIEKLSELKGISPILDAAVILEITNQEEMIRDFERQVMVALASMKEFDPIAKIPVYVAPVENIVDNILNIIKGDIKLDQTIFARIKKQIDEIGRPESLKEVEKNINELKKLLGISPEIDVIVRLKIEDQQKIIDDFNEKVEAELKKAKVIPLEETKLLANQKKLTDEQKKQYEAGEKLRKQEINRYNSQLKMMKVAESLSKIMGDTAEVLGAMSFTFGKISPELGAITSGLADSAHNAKRLFEDLSAGTITAGGLGAGIAVIGNIVGMFQELDSQDKQNRAEAMAAAYELQNKALEKQLKLMQELYGSDLTKSEIDLLKELERQLEIYDKRVADKYKTKIEERVKHWTGLFHVWEKFDVVNLKNVQDVKDLLDTWYIKEGLELGTIKVEDLSELLDIINSYDETLEKIEEIQNRVREQRLGFDSSGIAESIIEGIEAGLKATESGLGDWSNNFGELVKKALTQSILISLQSNQIKDFLDYFNQAMTDNVLTEAERDELTRLYLAAVQKAEDMWRDIEPILDEYKKPEDVSYDPYIASIQALTEDTGSIIAGQLTAVRLDLKEILRFGQTETNVFYGEIKEIFHTQQNESITFYNDNLSVLREIAQNTRHNQKLEKLSEDMEEMKNHVIRNL